MGSKEGTFGKNCTLRKEIKWQVEMNRSVLKGRRSAEALEKKRLQEGERKKSSGEKYPRVGESAEALGMEPLSLGTFSPPHWGVEPAGDGTSVQGREKEEGDGEALEGIP